MIWNVWDLEELTEASVVRDYSGWRLVLGGKPLGFEAKAPIYTGVNPPGLFLTLFFREREQLEAAMDKLKRMALALEETENIPPGDTLEPIPRAGIEEDVARSRLYDQEADREPEKEEVV